MRGGQTELLLLHDIQSLHLFPVSIALTLPGILCMVSKRREPRRLSHLSHSTPS